MCSQDLGSHLISGCFNDLPLDIKTKVERMPLGESSLGDLLGMVIYSSHVTGINLAED